MSFRGASKGFQSSMLAVLRKRTLQCVFRNDRGEIPSAHPKLHGSSEEFCVLSFPPPASFSLHSGVHQWRGKRWGGGRGLGLKGILS